MYNDDCDRLRVLMGGRFIPTVEAAHQNTFLASWRRAHVKAHARLHVSCFIMKQTTELHGEREVVAKQHKYAHPFQPRPHAMGQLKPKILVPGV